MQLKKTLKESFKLLKKHPLLFVPRFTTTALYSVYMLASADILISASDLTSAQAASDLVWALTAVIASLPLLYAADMISYAMYPSLVEDARSDKRADLLKALRRALSSWKQLAAFAFATLGFMMLVSTVSGGLYVFATLTGNFLYVFVSALLAAALTLAYASAVFFVVPAAVADSKSVAESFSSSIRLAKKNLSPLLKANTVFAFLALASLAFALTVEGAGSSAILLAAAYVLSRLVQATVYTYLCVANPVMYLDLRRYNNR